MYSIGITINYVNDDIYGKLIFKSVWNKLFITIEDD